MRKTVSCLAVSMMAVWCSGLQAEDNARTSPQPRAQTFNDVLFSADTETLSRMLIERKSQRGARTGADPRLDEEMARLQERLNVKLQGRADEDPLEQAPVTLYPRIVAPPPIPSPPSIPALPSVPATAQGVRAASIPSAAGLCTPLESETDAAARVQLERPVSVSFTAAPLEKVLEGIAQQMKAPIHVQWRALETLGIERGMAVTVDLQNVPARVALTATLRSIDTANVGHEIADARVTVSTREDLDSARFQAVRVYDVRDLITPTGFSHLPGEMLWSMRANQVTNLTDTIKAVVAPDTWRDNGGVIGSIREFNGLLIVNQAKDNHQEIERFLQQLRAFH
jgi:hypothetical protein